MGSKVQHEMGSKVHSDFNDPDPLLAYKSSSVLQNEGSVSSFQPKSPETGDYMYVLVQYDTRRPACALHCALHYCTRTKPVTASKFLDVHSLAMPLSNPWVKTLQMSTLPLGKACFSCLTTNHKATVILWFDFQFEFTIFNKLYSVPVPVFNIRNLFFNNLSLFSCM